MKSLPRYRVTKLFINGLLEGLTYVEETTVEWKVGDRRVKPFDGTSGFEIIAVERIA